MKKQKNNQLKQIQNQAQQGRSMVEMLGVLAIIGVLSIGGIAGYRWGMDKHVSNQILYEMNLNSAQLAMLLQKGNPDGVTLSLGSPYDEGKFRTVDYGFEYACGEEASFGHDCQYLDETMYSMTATGLPKRVCNMLGDAVFGMAYYYDSEINGGDNECNDTGNTVTVFFDTDTTVEGGIPRPEGPETHTPAPEVTEPVTSTTTTTESTTPETTTTEATTTTESTTTLTTTTVTTVTGDCSGHGRLLYYSGGDPNGIGSFCYCEDGYAGDRCEKQEETKECNENTDCGTGQYCYFSSSGDCTKQDGKGKCKSNTPNVKIKVNNKEFFVKFEWMTWWSAQNFCESHNKSMVSLADLQCSSESEAQIKSNGYGYCYKTGTSGELSDTIKGLSRKIGSYYWLSDLYGNDSCSAYIVYLDNGLGNNDNGLVSNDTRYHGFAYAALCE